jgi:hypothetical protein
MEKVFIIHKFSGILITEWLNLEITATLNKNLP